jgi:hypothetical protein
LLNIGKKVRVLLSGHKGFGITFLSKKYGVAKCTVCALKKKEAKTNSKVALHIFWNRKKKSLRTSVFPKMEEALCK